MDEEGYEDRGIARVPDAPMGFRAAPADEEGLVDLQEIPTHILAAETCRRIWRFISGGWR